MFSSLASNKKNQNEVAESNMCLDGDLENHLSSRTIIGDGVIYRSSDKETNFSLNK